MQQQEITRRVEFLFESAAGRGFAHRQYTAIRSGGNNDGDTGCRSARWHELAPHRAAVRRYRSCVCAAHGRCEMTAIGGDFERRLG
jgi:hypothetical protein